MDFSDLQSLLSTLLDDDGTTFWTTAERQRALNNAYFELYNLGANLSDGMGEEITASTLSQVSGTATIALPSDFYRLVSIYRTDSSNQDVTYRYIPIHPAKQHEFRRLVSPGSYQLGFYFRGSNIVLVPTPSTSATLNIEYVPDPTEMSADSDEPLLPVSHRELIAYGALVRLKEKEGVEPSGTTIATYNRLMSAFERDMESRQSQDSRRLAGPSGYNIYDSRI